MMCYVVGLFGQTLYMNGLSTCVVVIVLSAILIDLFGLKY